MRWTNFAIAGLVTGIVAGSPVIAGETSDTSRSELTAAAAYGRDIYQGRCSNCHSNKAGETAFAPTLYGLIGRKAGGLEGFPYSEKLQNLDFVWSNEFTQRLAALAKPRILPSFACVTSASRTRVTSIRS